MRTRNVPLQNKKINSFKVYGEKINKVGLEIYMSLYSTERWS